MKIKVDQILKDYEGKDIKLKNDLLKIRDVISTSLNSVDPQEKMSAEDKNKAYQISVKLWSKKEINLTLDDRKFIKDRVYKIYSPLICGRISDLFEGEK